MAIFSALLPEPDANIAMRFILFVIYFTGTRCLSSSSPYVFDTGMSFTLIRGGHVDATVLGALQVDEEGNLANWMVPGVFTPGMGGAMDLVVGAKKVIVAMEHKAKGEPKILKKCTLPLTAAKEVDLIVTERCVLRVEPRGLILQEVNPMFTIDDVVNSVGANLIIEEDNILQMAV